MVHRAYPHHHIPRQYTILYAVVHRFDMQKVAGCSYVHVAHDLLHGHKAQLQFATLF